MQGKAKKAKDMAEKYSKLDRVMGDLFILDCISKFAFMDL